MSKKYGLILKKKTNEDTSNRINYEATKLKRESKLMIDKALEEDPNIFAYDEIYDDIKKDQNVSQKNVASKEVQKKSKFIESLKINAETRKAAEERRQDRKIEKEREAEGDLYKDKEVFVTNAYRQKLMERKIYEEREKKEQELEDLMDATKQQEHGITAFYRNFLNQKVGEQVELNPKEKYLNKMTEDLRKQLIDRKEDDNLTNDRTEFKKSTKNLKSQRRRELSNSSEESVQNLGENKEKRKSNETYESSKYKNKDAKKKVSKSTNEEETKEKINSKYLKKEEENKSKRENEKDSDGDLNNKKKVNEEKIVEPEQIQLSLREILTDLFRKRCVGDEFSKAQKRYFERKVS